MKNALIVGAIAAAMSAVPAFAQTTAGNPSSNPKGTTQAGSSDTGSSGRSGMSGTQSQSQASAKTAASADQAFIHKAAEGGLAEVELGNLAKDKATNDQVKQFAQRMVDDHGKANDELKTLAQNKGITLPTDTDAKHKALKDRLSKLSGEQFDRAYMEAMLKDHRQDVSEFRKESKSAKDPDVKAFAAKTLPTLEEHLKLAQQDSGAVATSGTRSSKGGNSTEKKPAKTPGATDKK